MTRRKKALSVSNPNKAVAKAKPARKVSKSVPKKAASKADTSSVAAEVKSSDKATTEDVLGPDSGAPVTEATTKATSASEK